MDIYFHSICKEKILELEFVVWEPEILKRELEEVVPKICDYL